MQTSIQTALEGAVTSLPPEQAVMLPDNLLAAFLRLPVAHRRALLVASRLEVWVSMMSYEPGVARRYALLSAGESLPPVPEEQPEYTPASVSTITTSRVRSWLAREILARHPGQLQQLEDQLARLMLIDGQAPTLSRHTIETYLGEYGMAALRVTRCFKRVGSGQIRLASVSCPHPPTHPPTH